MILADRDSDRFAFENLADALAPGTGETPLDVRLFGKPATRPNRRMGVALARAGDVETARARAREAAARVSISYF